MTTTQEIATETLPFLTRDIAAVPGSIKRRYEDFRVEEIPAYEPCGSGDHCYFVIEKAGLATMRAVNDIARALGVLSRDIGLAGLKDARAVTRQMLSVEHVDPAKVAALEIPRIKVLSVSRHRNKLKIGHLRGNRFRIKLRESDAGRLGDIRAVLDVLHHRGVPNYFGSQRFGSRGDTWQLGRGVLRNDPQTVIDLMLGRPTAHDTGEVLKARQLYEEGKFAASAKAWPYGFRDNARACRVMEKTHGNHRRAMFAVDLRLKKFFVSAYQSHLFNRFLAERIGEIDKVIEGDLAYKHENGAVFHVEDAAAESPRAAAFEISATGPIFGYRMTEASGEPGRVEQSILAAEGLSLDEFRFIKGMKVHGARRPVRFALDELGVDSGTDDHGPYVELAFTLAAGCYATMILREICKDKLAEGLDESDE
ncbi:MAG TPA: tRNA pseudouridine(13) synthase TruD [Phycisphaerae bacterium]|nr:tRNA pseudouridine(13) synthase TruD [Phycisphaerae bacterium]